MFIVANFQETAVIVIHLIGAISCFGVGTLYMIAQSWITYRMCPLFCSKRIGYIRISLAIGSIVCFLIALGFGIAAANTFHKYHPDLPTPRPWSRKDHQEGYVLHCISSVAEWLMAALHVGFLLSYSRDFEKIRVEMGVQPLVAHLDQSPIWRSLSDLSTSP
uniref:DNA damage-regulated autophagy modulator protein 2 n=1 Tax=Acrobeloides nanus TaxID=290746 RepID=A0A914DAB2_9BILA